jgi:hypothetical protein
MTKEKKQPINIGSALGSLIPNPLTPVAKGDKVIASGGAGGFDSHKSLETSQEQGIKDKIITKFADAWKVYGTGYDWHHYKKKPVVIKAIQMDSDFKVATKEGISLAGKSGDYLLKGIEGEVYPCDKLIFEKTYRKVK